jgi:predicted ribosome quality control (RQC) complex YloA/Tae2 family protein
MDDAFLSALAREIRPLLTDRPLGRISASGADFIIDLRLAEGRAVVASLDPAEASLYLGHYQQSESQSPFALFLRKRLAGSRLTAIRKEPRDRIVYFTFEGFLASGDKDTATVAVSLTGRTANVYLIDAQGRIEARSFERGLQAGEQWRESDEEFDADALLSGLDHASEQAEILEKKSESLSPALKREFAARCREQTPFEAFHSLIDDAFRKKPVALIYSRLPIEEAGERLIDLKSDFLLSHFELSQAAGLRRYEFDSLSEAAERYYAARNRAKAFQNLFHSIRRLIAAEIKKREKLLEALSKDQAKHENPERLKREGELLLANIATARVEGRRARVTDYYDENQPEIEIEIREGETLQQAAARLFARYQKSKRALEAIAPQKNKVEAERDSLKEILGALDQEPTAHRLAASRAEMERITGRKTSLSRSKKQRSEKTLGRSFRSTDGYEIVVGRNDDENDRVTFRLARSTDIWLHAADYPGSHVIIRKTGREAVPQRTMIEAAQVAAFYSQAKRDSKVAVHYTERKFVSKPPRSKPGLVRLSSFKTVLVEPVCNVERIE